MGEKKSGDETLKDLAKYGYIYIPDNAIFLIIPFFSFSPLLASFFYIHTLKPK
jgi:hypothetical protein